MNGRGTTSAISGGYPILSPRVPVLSQHSSPHLVLSQHSVYIYVHHSTTLVSHYLVSENLCYGKFFPMDMEHSRANPAVVLTHSNQEYHISVPAAAGPHLQPLPSPICGNYLYPCFKISTIVVLVFIFILFVVVPALVIPDFRVEPASSSGTFNVSASGIFLSCDVGIRVKNPSSYFRVNYTHGRATLEYSGKRLSGASLSPFVLGAKKQATVAAAFESNVSSSRNSWQAITLASSVSRGEVSVDVNLVVGRRIGLGKWWIGAFDLTISCKDMIFTSPSSEGQDWALITPSELCDIGFFGYI